jgi:UDP-glucose 4-epimerase
MSVSTLGDNKKIVVFGSEGFVGSAICQDLLNNGYTVVGVDNYLKGYTPTKHFYHENFSFIRSDLTMRVPAVVGCDAWIVAAATLGGISYFHDHAFDMIAYNNLLMSKILMSAREQKPKKVVYLSSSMVYENVEHFPSKEEYTEQYPAPSSSYGFAKLSGERMVEALFLEHGIEYSICRLFNCIGPDEKFDLPFKQGAVHVLPEFVYQALTVTDPKAPVQLIGNGNQIRCFTDRRDLARGIRLAMEYGKNQTFNISTPIPTKISDLLNAVWELVHGHKATSKTGIDLPYDVQVRIPDVDKAKNLLNFSPEYSLTQSIKEVVLWMEKQLQK